MSLTRRDLLLGLPSMAAGYAVSEVSNRTSRSKRDGSFRLAHLTDLHISLGRIPEQSVARAVEHAQEQGAQLLVNGGDAIYDALQLGRGESRAQWTAFHQAFVRNSSVPILHVVGNHDIETWATADRDPDAKKVTLDHLGQERRYYTHEVAGWKLIVLDSVAWSPGPGYLAGLDDEQLAWLEVELQQNSKPCCIISHIPILTACGFFDGPNERPNSWFMPGAWMHLDARAIKDIFRRHPEVKLCLSGHIHLADRLDYLGVTYFCNGAVCGNYWKGAYQEFEPAYALVDLHPDGTFEHRLVTYLS